jgi:hypothetical protein
MPGGEEGAEAEVGDEAVDDELDGGRGAAASSNAPSSAGETTLGSVIVAPPTVGTAVDLGQREREEEEQQQQQQPPRRMLLLFKATEWQK